MCEPIAFTREMLEGDPRDAVERLRVEIGEGFTGWVAANGEPLLVNDALDDERGKTIDGTEDIHESMLVVPMLYEGRALGVIALSQLGFNQFTERRPPDHARSSPATRRRRWPTPRATSSSSTSRASSRAAPTPSAGCWRSTSASCRRSTMPTSSRRSPTAFGDVVAYDNLSIYRDRPGGPGHGPGPHPRTARRGGQPLPDPVRPRADGLGGRALAADPGQRRPQRSARTPDPRDPA